VPLPNSEVGFLVSHRLATTLSERHARGPGGSGVGS